jgi:uncharacterized membrane protein YkvA (DUF1232 family)
MGIGVRHGLRDRVRALKRDTLALYLAARHPRTPWYAKALAAFLAAYLLSPIDVIPDFVPVLGYLDDLVVISLGVLLVRRLVPADVLEECRKRAAEAFATDRPVSKSAAAVVVVVWVCAAVLVGTLIVRVIWR